ncbi:MAG: IS607 family transposase [Promethearchaeota archaeon]
MLSISEAADYLGVSPVTLRRWDKNGILKPHRTPGNHRRYSLQQLRAVYGGKLEEGEDDGTESELIEGEQINRNTSDESNVGDKGEIEKKLGKEACKGGDKCYEEVSDYYNRNAAVYCRVSTATQRLDGGLGRQIETAVKHAKAMGYTRIKVYKDVASGLNARRDGLNRMLSAAKRREFGAVICTYPDRLSRFGVYLIERYLKDYNIKVHYCKKGGSQKSAQEELTQDLISIITSFSCRIYNSRAQENFRLDRVKAKELIPEFLKYCRQNNLDIESKSLDKFLEDKSIKLMKRNKKFVVKQCKLILAGKINIEGQKIYTVCEIAKNS